MTYPYHDHRGLNEQEIQEYFLERSSLLLEKLEDFMQYEVQLGYLSPIDLRILDLLYYVLKPIFEPKYEYQILELDDLDANGKEFNKKINKLGEQGWSLSSCLSRRDKQGKNINQYIFKKIITKYSLQQIEHLYRIKFSAYPEVKNDLIASLNISDELEKKLRKKGVIYLAQLCKFNFAEDLREKLNLTKKETDEITGEWEVLCQIF